MYTYLGEYPYKTNLGGLAEEINGVCHDSNNWFFAQNGNLWKYPVSFDLNSIRSEKQGPDVLVVGKDNKIKIINPRRAIYKHERVKGEHFGDIDYYEGKIYVPVKVGSKCTIRMYNASNLTFVKEQVMKRADGKPFSDIGWLAINPNNGFLYTSENTISSKSPIYIYKIGSFDKSETLEFITTAKLFDENRKELTRGCMQGGCFDAYNRLYLNNGYFKGLDWDSKKTFPLTYRDSYANSKGGISVFKTPSSLPTKGTCQNLIRIAASNQKSGFRYQFDGEYQEPEGLTWWDLDKNANKAPKISGQLHAIMLGNKSKIMKSTNYDHIYFKHYKCNATTT